MRKRRPGTQSCLALPVVVGWAAASGTALALALTTLRVIGTVRAYVSAKHCGLSLVLSKETRATLTACCVDRAMGTSAGTGLAI